MILKYVETLKLKKLPIHSTRSHLNALVAHSPKTQKSLPRPLKNMRECGFNLKFTSKICPEESQAESMGTVPLGPAISSSDSTNQIHKSPNWSEILKIKTESTVWCPVDVKASLSHMIPHVTAETSEEFEGHEKLMASKMFQAHRGSYNTSAALQSPLSPILPQTTSRGPAAAAEPEAPRRRSYCRSGRLVSRSC